MNNKITVKDIFALIGAGILVFLLSRKKPKKKRPEKGIIIGDSQTLYIARQTKKASMLGRTGSEQNLWKGSTTLSWLENAVSKFPVTPEIGHVVVNTGTNGGFRQSDDIEGLFDELKKKFPNALFYTVKGSWGWGGNVNVTPIKVDNYYNRFKKFSEIIEPAIGSTTNPHGDLPVYKQIGKAIDEAIEKNQND